MRNRLRGARLFLTLAPTTIRLQWEVRALERRADRGEDVALRAAVVRRRLNAAMARIEREAV